MIRENLAAAGSLAVVCEAAARLLYDQITLLEQTWHQNRTAARDLVEQIMALDESTARLHFDDDLDHRLIRLGAWALWVLNQLGDSAARAIVLGERLLADHERILGPDHRDTLQSRNNLGTAYHYAGRTDEASILHEQNLTNCERTLGRAHPVTAASRQNLTAAYRTAGREDDAKRLES